MTNIAVTGGIACGKSLVGTIFSGEGVPVCDADELAHELMAPGGATYEPVLSAFGKSILDAEGRIDRRVLGRLVFEDAEQRERLNAIVHPAVKAAWEPWIAKQADTSSEAAVLIPLLYEAGFDENWGAVVCVVASRETQLARLARRGQDKDEALLRIESQMPGAAKAARSDYVIVNDTSMDVLREQTLRVLRRIRET